MIVAAADYASTASGYVITFMSLALAGLVGIVYRGLKADNRATREAVTAQGVNNSTLQSTVQAVEHAVKALDATVTTLKEHDVKSDERMDMLVRSGSRLEQVVADHLQYANQAETRIENRLNLRKDLHE